MAANDRPHLALNFNTMPAEFEKCRAAGGKIRTKRLNADEYMHICIPPGGGKGDSVAGEVKKYKKLSRAKSKK